MKMPSVTEDAYAINDMVSSAKLAWHDTAYAYICRKTRLINKAPCVLAASMLPAHVPTHHATKVDTHLLPCASLCLMMNMYASQLDIINDCTLPSKLRFMCPAL